MNHRRYKRKRNECLNHRQVQYEKALDGLLEGRIPPDYVNERYRKLKDIKKR